MEVPQKLNTKDVFVNDSKADMKDPQMEVEKELNEIREARPTPLAKRWKPKQYQKANMIIYIFTFFPIIILSLPKGQNLLMFFRGQNLPITPGLWKNQNLGWRKKEEKLCKSWNLSRKLEWSLWKYLKIKR